MSRIGKQFLFLSATVLLTAVTLTIAAQTAQTGKPKRINQAIELLAEGQPIYYTGSHSGTNGTYEQGVKDAQTYADYISYDMEHAPFDVKGLQEYMRGLVAGGPSRSGHRTPAVIVNVPVNGMDAEAVHANAWMFNQVLATGVHGVMLTHADDPGAIRAFVEAVRFPIHQEGVGVDGLPEGRRGVHGVANAAQIWGVSQEEYEDKADPWPLNPNGELLLGVKEEDKYALGQCRREPEGAWHRHGGMGSGGYGNVARRPCARRGRHPGSEDGCGTQQSARRLQGQPYFLPKLVQRERRDFHDQGRRDGRASQP